MLKKYDGSFLLLLILGLLLFLPIMPAMPVPNNLDWSWKLVMNEILTQHWVLGQDIVFNYGVFAYLHTYMYSPGLLIPMLLFRLGFIVTLLAYLYSFMAHREMSRKIILPLIFLTVALPLYFSDAFYLAYSLIFALYVITQDQRINFWSLVGSLLLAVVALIKLSFTFDTLLIMFLLTYLDIRKRVLPLRMLVYAITLILALILNHQPLRAVPLIINNGLDFVKGYGPAMAMLQNNYFALIMYLILASFLVRSFSHLAIFKHKDRRYAMVFLLIFSLFNMFKEGFVRADHVYFAYGYLLDLSVLLLIFFAGESAPFIQIFKKRRRFFLIILILVLSVVCFTYKTLPNLMQNYSNVSNYAHLAVDYEADMKVIRTQHPLPKVIGNADIYSYDQTILLANQLNYDPRPMFQSVTAFDSKFLKLNRDFLLSKRAPDNIFFSVQPTDNRYPSLEDGLSWPVLLTHYNLKQSLAAYLWLTKMSRPSYAIHLVPLGTYHYQIGSPISLAPFNNQYLWAQMTFNNNVLLDIVSLAFKPQEIYLHVTLANNQTFTYRLIAGMSSTGFLLSPLVANAQDFAALYTLAARQALLASNKIKYISVSYKGWQRIISTDDFQISWYKMVFK